jgi:hypothetical protein
MYGVNYRRKGSRTCPYSGSGQLFLNNCMIGTEPALKIFQKPLFYDEISRMPGFLKTGDKPHLFTINQPQHHV